MNTMNEQIDRNVAQLKQTGLLIFEGEDALSLLLRLCYLDPVAGITLHCERGPGLEPFKVENFQPIDFAVKPKDDLVEICGLTSGDVHMLYWSGKQNHIATGDVITYVSAPVAGFPEDKLASFPAPVMARLSQTTFGATPFHS